MPPSRAFPSFVWVVWRGKTIFTAANRRWLAGWLARSLAGMDSYLPRSHSSRIYHKLSPQNCATGYRINTRTSEIYFWYRTRLYLNDHCVTSYLSRSVDRNVYLRTKHVFSARTFSSIEAGRKSSWRIFEHSLIATRQNVNHERSCFGQFYFLDQYKFDTIFLTR